MKNPRPRTLKRKNQRIDRPGRIGHGCATQQMADLCGEPTTASLPRTQNCAGAPNLGDDSGRHEDHRTTESTEITERRIRRRRTGSKRMRSRDHEEDQRSGDRGSSNAPDQFQRPTGSNDFGSEWQFMTELRGFFSVISVFSVVRCVCISAALGCPSLRSPAVA